MKSFPRFVLIWCAILMLGLAFGIHRGLAQTAGGFVAPGPGAAPDPCNYAPHNSVPISTATSGTTDLIPAKVPATGPSRETSICNVNVSIAASSTLAFYQGAAAATTGLTQLSGAETAVLANPANATEMRANAGNDIFSKTTGTGVQGWVTYVYENQQPQIVPTPTPWASATPT